MLSRLNAFGRSLRSFLKQIRKFSSDSPQPLAATQKSTPGTKEAVVNNVEHKEREINLHSPRDLRTPLPGNVGFSLQRYTDIIQLSKIPNATTIHDSGLVKDHTNERIHDLINQFLEETNIIEKYEDPMVVASDALECTIHSCPNLIKEDFKRLFPHRELGPSAPFTILVICHKTEADMASWSEEGELEKEGLISMFSEAAQEMCSVLNEHGHWAEYIDPRTGTLSGLYTDKATSATLYETDERYRHFGFEIDDLGCCKVVSHHAWGTKMFVGSIFTNAAPESDVMHLLVAKYAKLFPSPPPKTNK